MECKQSPSPLKILDQHENWGELQIIFYKIFGGVFMEADIADGRYYSRVKSNPQLSRRNRGYYEFKTCRRNCKFCTSVHNLPYFHRYSVDEKLCSRKGNARTVIKHVNIIEADVYLFRKIRTSLSSTEN